MALLTDIADGMLARRLGAGTELVRRLDSIADTVFWACAAAAAWKLHGTTLRPYLPGVAAIVALEVIRYLFDAVKFRREAAWHAWSAKAWGISLAVAAVALFLNGTARPTLDAAIVIGIVADLEGLAISGILPRWTHDVPSVFHAWERRRCILASACRGRP